MTEHTHRCDRCGDTIDADRLKLAVTIGTALAAWPICLATGRAGLDVCPSCRDDLGAWLAERKAGRRPEPALAAC